MQLFKSSFKAYIILCIFTWLKSGREREEEKSLWLYVFFKLHWVTTVLEYNPLGISPAGLSLNCIVFIFQMIPQTAWEQVCLCQSWHIAPCLFRICRCQPLLSISCSFSPHPEGVWNIWWSMGKSIKYLNYTGCLGFTLPLQLHFLNLQCSLFLHQLLSWETSVCCNRSLGWKGSCLFYQAFSVYTELLKWHPATNLIISRSWALQGKINKVFFQKIQEISCRETSLPLLIFQWKEACKEYKGSPTNNIKIKVKKIIWHNG